MSDLYLIAHKVRSEPAFDIAERMECPECLAQGCAECDQLGYWWIIPTSGHRAYPWWHLNLQFNDTGLVMDHNPEKLHWTIFDMPEGLPDHYPTIAPHDKPKLNLAGLMPKSAPIRRRV